jgi:fucose permease
VQRIGRAKTLIGAEMLLVVGYTTIVATPPFGVVAFSFFLLGLGMATNLTLTQLFLANLANNTPVLGLFHGMYGIGGTVGPLIATSLVSKGLVWSRFYAILLGLAALNAVGLGITFWGYERDHPELEDLLPVLSSSADISFSSAAGAAGEPDRNRNHQRQCAKSVSSGIRSRWRTFHTLLSNPPTTLGSIFIFAYQGAEVAISGWVISFLITFRSGDPSRVGYVTSGFWAGITIGRFTLTFLAHRVGERGFVFFCTAGAMALECLIWLVPSIPGSSVAVALSGLLLGPVYPCGVHILKRLIPRGMQVNSMTLITGVGSSGGAMAPFVTGLLAQKVSLGTAVLHPVCLVLFVVMGGSWWGMPKVGRRDE